jgi:hypothetical protein
MTFSPAIDALVALAVSDGNQVVEISTGWSKVREVVHMRDPVSVALETAGRTAPGLRRWQVEPTPHNKGEFGFTDDIEKVSISFPCPISK